MPAFWPNLVRSPLGVGDDKEFRISIAGAQEKTALLYWRKRWLVPHGTTATTHILKPQIGKLESGIDLSKSVENEHLCLKLVQAFGIQAADTQIADFAGRRVLVVERFDRRRTRNQRLLRLPQEDCCQALSVPPTLKYQSDGGPGIRQIAGLLKGSDTPAKDQILFLKAQVVLWLLAATDGHAKFRASIWRRAGVSTSPRSTTWFRRSPASMPTKFATTKPSSPCRSARVRPLLGRILPRHFLQTAGLCGIPQASANAMLEELGDTGAAAIDKVLADLPDNFPREIATSIAQGAKARLEQIGVQATAD